MTLEDLERLAFLLRNRLTFPDVLALPLEAAIVNWFQDPARRSLDFWLALPPRAPHADVDYAQQRDRIYRQLAETIPGSTRTRSQIILADLEIWQSGDAPVTSFSEAFEIFLRAWRELESPHLKQTALRGVISA